MAAMSSGVQTKPNGDWASRSRMLATPKVDISLRPMSVSTRPGATMFTRMPLARSSLARVWARASTPGLADRIGEEAHPRPHRLGGDGRDHDHVAAGRGAHVGDEGAAEMDRAPEVDAHQQLDLVLGGAGDGRAIHVGRAEARVVDQGVDLAEVGDGALAHGAHGRRVGDVGPVDLGADAEGPGLIGHFAGGGFVAGVVDRDIGAFAGEAQRHGAADATAAAGDQRRAAFELSH